MVERLLQHVGPASRPGAPQAVTGDADVRCTTCGRTGAECTHLVSGTRAVVCDHCVGDIARGRRAMIAPDDAVCHLCGRTHFESRAVYRHNGVDICADCLDLSMGLLERDEIDKFLAEW